jgi:hypothetical protein
MQVGVPTVDAPDLSLGEWLAQYYDAVLVLDGTLTEDETPKMKNLGSAGSVLDGTLTDVTVDADGMHFNGSTSKIVVPTHTSLTGLSTYTYITIAKPASSGGGGSGRLWNWGNLSHVGWIAGSSSPWIVNTQIARASTPAQVSVTNFVPTGTEFYHSVRWTGSVISSLTAKKGDSGLTGPNTTTNGSGAITSLTGQVLNVGNRTLNDRGWNGIIKLIAVIPSVLLDGDDLEVARRALIVNPT